MPGWAIALTIIGSAVVLFALLELFTTDTPYGVNAEATVTVPNTGTWLVRNGIAEQGHFDSFGRWCADDDCEITHA